VSPQTTHLSVAFQDNRVNTADTRICPNRFIVHPQTGATQNSAASTLAGFKLRPESKLTRLQLFYAGQTFPQNELQLSPESFHRGYADYVRNTQQLFNNGGAESYADWLAEGVLFSFAVHKDGADKSTLVRINATNSMTSNEASVSSLLLFDHYKSLVKVDMRDNAVVSVTNYDM
jgi:hypothetical protein